MANWDALKSAIANVIKTNGHQEITGHLLQNVLNNIVSSLGENATFAGIATPVTNPGVPDGPCFYFATQAGIYTNFGSMELNDGLNIIRWNGTSWSSNNMMRIVQEPDNSKNIMSASAICELFNKTSLSIPELFSQIVKELTENENENITITDDNGNEIAKFIANGFASKAFYILESDGSLKPLTGGSVGAVNITPKGIHNVNNLNKSLFSYNFSESINTDFATNANWSIYDGTLQSTSAGIGNRLVNNKIYSIAEKKHIL